MKTNNKISQILCLIFSIFIFSFSALNVHASEVVEAVENVADNTETAPTANANVSGNTDSVSGDSDESEVDSSDLTESGGASAMSENDGESFQSELVIKPLDIFPSGNSGAVITNIPIIVPAGRKGIQPNLSINYNSGSGNGWIGVGWGLDMGAIERNRKYDVDYSANDFIVTGNGASELVQRSDWPGHYGAKIEDDFSKYRYVTAEDRWEMIRKDGTKLFYGKDPYTGHEAKLSNASFGTFKWCLVRVQDSNGNYMTITYVKDPADPVHSDIYPEEIHYTGRVDSSGSVTILPANNVHFYRDDGMRTDIPVSYSSKWQVRTKYRLNEIEVISDAVSVRRYKLIYDADLSTEELFEYSPGTERSLLGKVKQFGKEGTVQALPELIFNYTNFDYPNEGEQTTDWPSSGTMPDGTSGANYNFPHIYNYIGDVNGDGRKDVISIPTFRQTFYVTVSNGSGWHLPERWGRDFAVDGARDANFNRGFNYIADVNGDGKTDMVTIPSYSTTFYVLKSTGDGFEQAVKWGHEFAVNGVRDANFDYGFNYPADVNGDGKTDMITIPTWTSTFYVLISTGDGFEPAVKWGVDTTSDGASGSNYDKGYNYTADLNGDGKTDIVYIPTGRTGWYAYISTGTGFEPPRPWFTGLTPDGSNPSNFDSSAKYNRFVDVNDDGKTDLVYVPSYKCAWYVGLSTGEKFESPTNWDNNGRWGCEARHFHFADVNGDGVTDQIHISTEPTGYMFVALSNGKDKFIPASPYKWHIGWANDPNRFAIGDVSGDDRADLLHWSSAGHILAAVIKDPYPDLLTTISNGMGGTTTVDYRPSSAYDNCKTVDNKEVCLPFVVQTLSSVTVNDGNTGVNGGLGVDSVTEYDYSGGYFDYVDREFRGFDSVTSTAQGATENETLYTETLYHQDDIKKGLPAEQTTKDSLEENYNIYTKTINSYETDYIPNSEVHFPRLVQQDQYVCDRNCTETNMAAVALKARVKTTYDNYGNIKNKKYYGKVTIETLDREENTEYYPDNSYGNWLVSLKEKVEIKDGTGVLKAETKYDYYQTTGNLKTEDKWLNTTSSYLRTSYQYDSYGNIWKVTDPRNIVTQYDYDLATHTFPVKVTNDLNGFAYYKETEYDDVFIDKVHIETDYNGKDTRYDYDVFGRIEKITKPSPYGITKYTYDDINRIKTVESKDRAGNVRQWQETYYDGLGRTIRTRSGGKNHDGSNATVIAVETQYDERGQVYTKSNPYFEGVQTIYDTVYTYDAMNRLIYTLNPDDTSSSVSYDRGWTSYIDANSHRKDAYKDIYGQIVEVNEYTGNNTAEKPYVLYATTSYEYDVLGNLKTVTDAKGNQTSMIYDSLSRKREMIDPDMGHWYYNYDENSNLMYQKDAKNQEITFDPYDALNRFTKKNYPDNSYIEYKYDESFSSNSIGRLTTVTRTDSTGTPTSITKTYYDELGNVKQTDRTIGASGPYVTYTFYDVLERVSKIKYPDLSEVDYTYDGHGNILQILNGGDPYVTYNEYNALAQPEFVTFHNDVTTDYEYYSDNNRLQSIVTKNSSGLPIIDLSYVITDDAGKINSNIMKIIDNLDGNKTRTFKYDDLDRLIEADSASYGGNVVYQYDTFGNMTYNCRYGHYYYEDPDHIHAVTKIKKTDGTVVDSYNYDANGNMYSGAGRTLTYDYDNMPTRVTYESIDVDSVYDAGGQRIKKSTSSSTTIYIGQIYECTNGSCTKHILAGTQLIASITGSETLYYHTDHLGSSSVITDDDGTGEEVVEEIYYYPYGETKTDTTPPGENVNVRYKYTGKELDGETGLYYYGARYYDPKLARFISADTIVPKPFYPISLNRYAYAYNNPIILKDLDGHEPSWADNWDNFWKEQDKRWDKFYGSAKTGISSAWNNRHDILAGAGMAPAVGIFADAADTVLYAFEGDWGGVAWGVGAMVPGFGQITRSAQYGRKAFKYSDEVVGGVDDGIVYLRKNFDTGKEYVGQSISESRYIKRQAEHARKNPDSDFEYSILERAKPGRSLNVAEESWIRAGGGPRNKSNPYGLLENKRWQMNDYRYRSSGGQIER